MHSLLQRSASHHDKKSKKYNTVHSPGDTSAAATRSEQDPMAAPPPHDEVLEEMVVDSTNVVNNGEAEIPGEDGPWSINVGDAPSNKKKKKYALYIRTPTQNLTLIRAVQEITDLHAKLRSNHPKAALLLLPMFPTLGTDTGGAKLRTSLLGALNRLMSPKSKAKPGQISSVSPTDASTPTIAPQSPIVDEPVPHMSQPSGVAPGAEDGTEQTMPALAAYLTLVGNHPIFRHARAWRRFVRVRTDDLQSVRTERVVKRVQSESGLGRSGSQGGSASSLRASHDVRSGKPVPDLPPMPTMSSLDSRASVSDASEGITEEDEDETARDKELPHLPGSSERTPSNKPAVLPDAMPPVSEILASPSIQQAIAAPGIPEPRATPPRLTTALPGVKATPTASECQTLPTPGATPIPLPQSKAPAPVEHSLSSGSDVYVNGNGSEADNNGFGKFSTRSETETELDPEGDTAPDETVKMFENNREKKPMRKAAVDDFKMMRVIGKGCAGKVLLVRHRASNELYALKVIPKRHVLAHLDLQQTLTEQAVLKRMAREGRNSFVVKLWWSFHDKDNLFLVMDFHPGGNLATLLARCSRLGRGRTGFYATEIVEGCEGLHVAGVIHRDLKPENVLIGADGHIVLADFGLSKEFPRKVTGRSPTAPHTPSGLVAVPYWMDATGSSERESTAKCLDRDTTTTFCGAAKYLAPEVIQCLPYSYEVDWWSFGTIMYEMLTGVTPFWANNYSDMCARVLHDELQFPDDKAMDQDTKSFICGLLQKNPALRMCEPQVKKHPYFSMIDWQHVYYKRYIPPYTPPIDSSNVGDTQNFDKEFLEMEPVIADETDHTNSESEDVDLHSESARNTWGDAKSPGRPAGDGHEETVNVFDGYSFQGRDSIVIDEESEEEHEHEQHDERIRNAEVSQLEASGGPITVDKEATLNITRVGLPKADGKHFALTTPATEAPQPTALVEVNPVASFAKPKPPQPDVSLGLAASLEQDDTPLSPLPAKMPRKIAPSVALPATTSAVSSGPDPIPVPIPTTEPIPVARVTKGHEILDIVPLLDRVLDSSIGGSNRDLAEKSRKVTHTDLSESSLDGSDSEVVNPSQLQTLQYAASVMFKRLVRHGCPDLSSAVNPNGFSPFAVAEGGFGDIWTGVLHDGTKLAIKVLRFTLATDDITNDVAKKQVKRATREIYNWSKLEHEHVHKLMGVIMFRERLGMVSRWMEHGHLRQYLNRNGSANRYQLYLPPDIQCHQIAKGVAYLHSVDMVHGDLKACNILVSPDGVIKLTDFDHSIASNCSLVFSATSRAPELLADDNMHPNKETDIYALGMTFLETVTNFVPYAECHRDAQIFGKISRKEYPKRSEEHFPQSEQSNQLWDLLIQCWDHDPVSRPTADNVLARVQNAYKP